MVRAGQPFKNLVGTKGMEQNRIRAAYEDMAAKCK